MVCILLPAEAGRGVGGTVSVLAITTQGSEGVLLQFSASIMDMVRSGLSAQVESGFDLFLTRKSVLFSQIILLKK